MKANKAPEKLYLSKIIYGTFQYQVPDPDDDTQIEYVRKDAFVEKSCEWLRNNSHNYANNALGKEYLVNDFKNYMKGE